MIVTKFGGSSLADAKQFEKVRNIINMDKRRIFVVPSAPGRRFDQDDKITDLLYQCHTLCEKGMSFTDTFTLIRTRYCEIAEQLNLQIEITKYLDIVEQDILNGASIDYCASRGEYLNGLLLADYLKYNFIDPKEAIFFYEDGSFDGEKTNSILKEKLCELNNAVIPGFYGSTPNGRIHTFSRGGSDITGAIVARAVNAEVYENWTDVAGFFMADPRIIKNVKSIGYITYDEMYELSHAGATVLHEDSIFPVSYAGIPTNVRNTNNPEHPGTMITSNATQRENFSIFAGLSGKKGFSILLAEKNKPDNSQLFVCSILEAFLECGLQFEYLPSGVNHICLIVSTTELKKVLTQVKNKIDKIEIPHTITIHDNIGMIVLVGYGIVHNRQTIARIHRVLKENDIDIHMINQGSSELSTWVGVDENSLEDAIRKIYEEFVV